VRVRVTRIKSNGSAKYVELSVECFWTRVRFPPPPPDSFSKNKKLHLVEIAAFLLRASRLRIGEVDIELS